MKEVLEKIQNEPVMVKAIVGALAGGVVSLVGLQVAPEVMAEFAAAATVVVMGIAAVIAAFVSRGEVMPVERMEPGSDVWWPKDPHKRQAWIRQYFKRKLPDAE